MGLFYWIICFPRSTLVYVLKSLVFTADHNRNRLSRQLSKTISQENKVQRLIKNKVDAAVTTQAAIPGSPWSYLSWGCWWSQLAFKYKLFPSKTCPLMVRSPKFICLSKTGWREMDCDWHFKSKLGSAKQMIRIKQMWTVYPKNKSGSSLFSIKLVLYDILGMHFVRIW